MQDLLKDKQLGKVLTAFHKAGKPTALVCHGPIALMSTLPNASEVVGQLEQGKPVKNGEWIYKNYRMTVISNQEEEQAKALLKGGEMKFYPFSSPRMRCNCMQRGISTASNCKRLSVS